MSATNVTTEVTGEDIFAGSFLVTMGLIGLCMGGAVFVALKSLSDQLNGFRFLVSQTVGDLLLFVQFGIAPGIVILRQESFFSTYLPRFWLHVLMDTVWFGMCLHYPLVAWSRFAAICRPVWFRKRTGRQCNLICVFTWLLGLSLSLATHLIGDWFTIFYYDAKSYGMTCVDWEKYMNEGTNAFYRVTNVLFITLPFLFYFPAIRSLWQRSVRNRKIAVAKLENRPPDRPNQYGKSIVTSQRMSTERRMLACCMANAILFVVTQIFVIIGFGTGKWMGWSVMVIFVLNSYGNPLTVLIFSSSTQTQLLHRASTLRSIPNAFFANSPNVTNTPSFLRRSKDIFKINLNP